MVEIEWIESEKSKRMGRNIEPDTMLLAWVVLNLYRGLKSIVKDSLVVEDPLYSVIKTMNPPALTLGAFAALIASSRLVLIWSGAGTSRFI
jgi:hypothetical protein